jgi:hypothetical protein
LAGSRFTGCARPDTQNADGPGRDPEEVSSVDTHPVPPFTQIFELLIVLKLQGVVKL